MVRIYGYIVVFIALTSSFNISAIYARNPAHIATNSGEIGVLEDYVFSENKEDALADLVPGSEEYYFFHTLYFQNLSLQNKEQLKNSARMLFEWENNKDNPGIRSVRFNHLKNRQAMLEYDKDPGKTLKYLKEELGLGFSHFKKSGAKQRSYPSSLDQGRISTKTISRELLNRRNATLSGFTTDGLYELDANDLNISQLRELLRRIDTPDYPGLTDLIKRELKDKHSSGFGSFTIHHNLTLTQLDKLKKSIKRLTSNDQFVAAYMKRVFTEKIRLQKDPHKKYSGLKNVWEFVSTLPESQNSIKIHLLYDLLKTGRKVGNYDKQLFIEYLKIPKHTAYAKYSRQKRSKIKVARFNSTVAMQSGFQRIDNDQKLVNTYLHHFFAKDKNYDVFLPYLEEKFLRYTFAEVKILNGIGDKKKWFAQLPASKYEQITERVELTIIPENKVKYGSDDTVELALNLKNIDSLVVNIYEINTMNYYKKLSEKVSVAINLEGLEPNYQQVIEFDKPSHIRHGYKLKLPDVSKAGVYVVDLVGNGINSRAVIEKGGLNYTQRAGVSGHLFRVYDSDNKLIIDSSVWLKGHTYTSDKYGRIIVPYTKKSTSQDIIVSGNGIASLHNFYHNSEEYSLHAGVLFNREAMISGNQTDIVISPQLLLNSNPVDNKILKDITVEINLSKITDNGTEIIEKKLFSDLQITDGEDIKIPFVINADSGALKLGVKLLADIENTSKNKTDKLEYSFSSPLNFELYKDVIADAYLRKYGGSYLVEIIGRNGELIPDHSLRFDFKHRNFTRKLMVNLQSDSSGKIELGELKGIEQIKVYDGDGIERTWDLIKEVANTPQHLTVKQGQNLVIPINSQQRISLFELADGHYLYDKSNTIDLDERAATLEKIKEGDYQFIAANKKFTITVECGVEESGFILSSDRYVQSSTHKPLLVTDISENGVFSNKLKIKTINHDAKTRVHIFGTRFFSEDLSSIYNPIPNQDLKSIPLHGGWSKYSSGRRLSDELRYIMERKQSNNYPGNMLKRPSLIINPLELGKTTTKTQSFKDGGRWDKEVMEEAMASPMSIAGRTVGGQLLLYSPSYNFMDGSSFSLLNQTPDKEGVVRVDESLLQGVEQLSIVVTNGQDTTYAYHILGDSKPKFRDIRQTQKYANSDHYRQENQIKVFNNLQKFNPKKQGVSDYEIYRSIDEVYALYKAISTDHRLNEFKFLLSWNKLDQSQKLHNYSKYGSHEVNFYLYHRDKQFFKSFVKPAISSKIKKDFIDDWLLNNDLTKYTEEHRYAELNVVEKALLAKRVKRQKQPILTELTDRFSSKEPDLYKLDRLFSIALTGGVDTRVDTPISKGDSFGMEAKKSKLMPRRKRSPMKPQAPMVSAAAGRMVKQNFMAEAADQAFEREQRQLIKQFYTAPDKTKSWIEHGYYGILPKDNSSNRVELNQFWLDYISAKQAFVLTEHIALASNNLTEMIFALAVIDLPTRDKLKSDGKKGVVFAKIINKESKVKHSTSILLGQNIFPKEQRYKYINNRKQENFIQDGFVKGKVYGMQTVLTNTTSLQEMQELFIKIPQGAIPVANGFYNKSMKVRLEPFATRTFENYFYFPVSGNFSLYPAHAFGLDGSMSFATGRKFTVHKSSIIADKNSWDYISQNGTEKEQLDYLQNKNLNRIDLSKIAYRLKDKEFFMRMIKILKDKHYYDKTTWSYAVKHNIPKDIADYLHLNGFADKCGDYLKSKLINISAEESGKYLHTEFWPLINKRVFQFGNKRYIENTNLLNQYNKLMSFLSYKGKLSDTDKLAISYYLLLQDRVDDAILWFGKVQRSKVAQQMQYDYMSAYIAFYNQDIKQAYSIAERYKKYPVERWRDMFADILSQAKQVNQVDQISQVEIAHQAHSTDALKDRSRLMFSFASQEPAIDIKTVGNEVQVRMQNINRCALKFYSMDLEVLFSRKPFAMQLSDQFAMIQPNLVLEIEKGADSGIAIVNIPQNLSGKSLLIEASAAGVSDSTNYYPNTLVTHISENYGITRVISSEDGKSINSVYVKVYAQMRNGDVKFYKDGYTDMRGMFDYLSQNHDNLEQIEKFAMLILSDNNGALIKEVRPPKM